MTVHPAPRVWIDPSGMFLAHQGERDRVHSENPVVAGLWDPKTPLSARDVIGRSHPGIARWGHVYFPSLFSIVVGFIYCNITLNVGDVFMKVTSQP